jgi:hypothetical protein
LRYGYRK